jgi:diguanylate cyclase (GGDEF)-like protein
VVLGGSIAAIAWVIMLDRVFELTTVGLAQAGSSGLIGAAGASVATLLLRMADRSDQRELHRVAHDASHDALTGLPNRAEMFRLLEKSISEAYQDETLLGVLFLDLDRFKIINDSMGHEVGDEVLRIVAERLRSTVRSTDVVARLGGDEFVVLCRGLEAPEAVVSVARQILAGFDQPVAIDGNDFRVGSSIGIALAVPDEPRPAEDLVRDADAAMYRAKKEKSGYAVFDDQHRKEAKGRQDIERQLRGAMERKEFTVHYQPIVDLADRSLYGFEALVRWNHPTKGLLGPGQFMPIAEKAGLMANLGEFVLREACAQAAVWNHISPAARTVKMCVNLAEQQLVDITLAERVAKVLDWARLPAEQLVLEITEDAIVAHRGSHDALRALVGLGVELSIDDFGTGRSSLAMEQLDMVSLLKIHERFVSDLRNNDAGHDVVGAVQAMAKNLGVRVVAEGVEYEDQLDHLQRMGVDLMQGYLFTSPMGAELIDPAIWFPSLGSVPTQLGSQAISEGFVRSTVATGEAAEAEGVAVSPRVGERQSR